MFCVIFQTVTLPDTPLATPLVRLLIEQALHNILASFPLLEAGSSTMKNQKNLSMIHALEHGCCLAYTANNV